MAPHDGQEAEQDRAHGHHLGANAVGRPLDDGLGQIAAILERTTLRVFRVREVEIEQHHRAGLRIEAGERDHPHPDRNAQVVVQQPHQPHRSDQRERHGEHHDRGLGHRAQVEVEQGEDEQQRDRNDQGEPGLGALVVLELPRPVEPVPRRELHPLGDRALCVVDEVGQRAIGNVHRHQRHELPIFVLDHGGAGAEVDVRQFGERDLGARWRGDEHALERLRIVAQLTGVAVIPPMADSITSWTSPTVSP